MSAAHLVIAAEWVGGVMLHHHPLDARGWVVA